LLVLTAHRRLLNEQLSCKNVAYFLLPVLQTTWSETRKVVTHVPLGLNTFSGQESDPKTHAEDYGYKERGRSYQNTHVFKHWRQSELFERAYALKFDKIFTRSLILIF
jgi:hypothetical protein